MSEPRQEVRVTYLEMRSPTELRPKRCEDGRFRIQEARVRQPVFNRWLYCTIGARWEWVGKRDWDVSQWEDFVNQDGHRTFVAYLEGSPVGYYERIPDGEGGIEILHFGLLPAFIGQGYGGALLTHALEQAWETGPKRVWLHTCTLDHPSALGNYQARGMKIYRQEIEARD